MKYMKILPSKSSDSSNIFLRIIFSILYLTALMISVMFAFFPIQAIIEFVGYMMSWSFSIIIGVIVWTSLSQVGVKRASDGSIRNRGKFSKKKYENLLLVSIIIFTLVLGVFLLVFGVPQEITRLIMVELERSELIQSIQLISLISFVLLLAIPLSILYIQNQTKQKKSIFPRTQNPTRKRKERARKNMKRKLGR